MNKSDDLAVWYLFFGTFSFAAWLVQELDSILAQSGFTVTIIGSVNRLINCEEDLVFKLVKMDSRIFILLQSEKFGGVAYNFFRTLRNVDISKDLNEV